MKRGDFLWIIVLLVISAVMIIPAARTVFIAATVARPYLTGFIKFAVLATMGEMLAVRLGSGRWKRIKGLFFKAVIWGVVGILIVLMFTLYSTGVEGAVGKGVLFTGNGFYTPLLTAFLISTIMNLTFAPAFMAAHRMTDTWIEMRTSGLKPGWSEVIDKIDWGNFYKFIVGKTIPFFWIPAHTVTFLLPGEYRVLLSAYLSVVLGIILSYTKKRNLNPASK